MDMKKQLVSSEPVQSVIEDVKTPENAPESVVAASIDIDNIPDVVFSGVIGERVDARGDRNIQHLAGALGVVSTIVCDRGYVRYSASDGRVKPSLFIAMVLPTNSNKSGFTNFINDSLSQLSELDAVRTVNTTESGQSLLASTVDIEDVEGSEKDSKGNPTWERTVTPYKTAFVYDELSRFFASALNPASTLVDDCLASYENTGKFTRSGVNMGRNLKNKANPKITYPSLDLNIFGNIVPHKFSSTLGDDRLITQGFTNRFLIFHSKKRPKFTGLEMPSKLDYNIEDIHQIVKRIHNNKVDIKHHPAFPTLMSKELLDYLATETCFKDLAVEFENPDEDNAPTSRAATMFTRLLLIYMLGNGRSHITKDDINAVDWIIRCYKESVDELLDPVNIQVNGTQYSERQSKLERKVERLLDTHGDSFTQQQFTDAFKRSGATQNEINSALEAHGVVKTEGEKPKAGKVPIIYRKL